MGCGSSSPQERDPLTPAKRKSSEEPAALPPVAPEKNGTGNGHGEDRKSTSMLEGEESTSAKTTAAGGWQNGSQRGSGGESRVYEEVSALEATRPESPETRRAGNKKKKQGAGDDGIATVLDEEDNDDNDDGGPPPAKGQAGGWAGNSNGGAHGAKRPPKLQIEEDDLEQYEDRPSTLLSTKHKSTEAILTLKQAENYTVNSPSDLLDSGALGRLSPGGGGAKAGTGGGGSKGANRYDLDLSDDDDENKSFDLDRFCRFYKWNKNKPSELMEFLWRNFDPKAFSIYCISFKNQDAVFAGFQGENMLYGLTCRLETLNVDYFGAMQTLYRQGRTMTSPDTYKVIGVLIFPGTDDIPLPLASLPDISDFQVLKADTRDPLVRQFVGKVISASSPVTEFQSVVYLQSQRTGPGGGGQL